MTSGGVGFGFLCFCLLRVVDEEGRDWELELGARSDLKYDFSGLVSNV